MGAMFCDALLYVQAMKGVVKDAGVMSLLDSLTPVLWHMPTDEQRAFTARVRPKNEQKECAVA